MEAVIEAEETKGKQKKKMGKEKTEQESKFDHAANELRILIRSRNPVVYIQSDEKEFSIMKIIYEMCQQGTHQNKEGKNYTKELFLWDIARGFTKPEFIDGNVINKSISDDSTKDAIQALDWIRTQNKDTDAIYILSEFHHVLHEPNIQRRLRLFSEETSLNERKMIILLSTKNDGMPNTGKIIPPELENVVYLFEWPYPDAIHIRRYLEQEDIPQLNEGFESAGYEKLKFSEDQIKDLVNACKGMTIAQIGRATAKSAVVHLNLIPKTIAQEKKQIVQKSGLCDYIEPNQKLADIGGVANLKRWLQARKGVLSEEAISFGCDLPNGVLLLGPWGSGKSSATKAIINEWGLPGIRIDAAKVYDQYVGASERHIRSILSLAESISPCILHWDEIENLLAGSESSASDGGTSSRVIGIISTWMQEHEGLVFNVFTANEIHGRPPKLFRKGRLDEIFIVDLPVEKEREDIYEIHITKRLAKQGTPRNKMKYNLNEFAVASYNFSGAEIEAAVNTAFITAFNDGKRMISQADILDAVQKTIPLSCTMREQIMTMREWQKGRAVLASDYAPEEIKTIEHYTQKLTGRNIEL